MIATTDADVLIARLAFAAAAIVASFSLIQSTIQGKRSTKAVDNLTEKVDTGNGHTIGTGVSRLEDQAWRHEQRLDRIEIETREMRELMREHIRESVAFWADIRAAVGAGYTDLSAAIDTQRAKEEAFETRTREEKGDAHGR